MRRPLFQFGPRRGLLAAMDGARAGGAYLTAAAFLASWDACGIIAPLTAASHGKRPWQALGAMARYRLPPMEFASDGGLF